MNNRYLVFEKADWNLKQIIERGIDEYQAKILFYQIIYGLNVFFFNFP